jgi:hypothetical protein
LKKLAELGAPAGGRGLRQADVVELLMGFMDAADLRHVAEVETRHPYSSAEWESLFLAEAGA